MKKVVLKVDLHDDKEKQKAMKAVSCLSGVVSIAMDMKEKKLTVTGDVDPVEVVSKLRKQWCAQIETVGPAKEEKKDDKKKEEDKKQEAKKEDDKKKEKDTNQQIQDLVNAYKAYNPHYTKYYHVLSAEENPNACTIC